MALCIIILTKVKVIPLIQITVPFLLGAVGGRVVGTMATLKVYTNMSMMKQHYSCQYIQTFLITEGGATIESLKLMNLV